MFLSLPPLLLPRLLIFLFFPPSFHSYILNDMHSRFFLIHIRGIYRRLTWRASSLHLSLRYQTILPLYISHFLLILLFSFSLASTRKKTWHTSWLLSQSPLVGTREGKCCLYIYIYPVCIQYITGEIGKREILCVCNECFLLVTRFLLIPPTCAPIHWICWVAIESTRWWCPER